jgi:hypothetical protein
MNKCNCTPEETTGWTTVKCCNICGLPIQAEVWDFETKNDGMKPADEQIKEKAMEHARHYPCLISTQILKENSFKAGVKWCRDQQSEPSIPIREIEE